MIQTPCDVYHLLIFFMFVYLGTRSLVLDYKIGELKARYELDRLADKEAQLDGEE